MKKPVIVLLSILILCCVVGFAGCQTDSKEGNDGWWQGVDFNLDNTLYLFLSPNGEDANDGKENSPKKTIAGVLEFIKENKDNLDKDIIVVLEDGNYYMQSQAVIDPDTMPKDVSLSFVARNYGKAVINGGEKIDLWKPVSLNGNTVLTAQLNSGLENIYNLKINDSNAKLACSIDGDFDSSNLSKQNSYRDYAEGSFGWDFLNIENKKEGIRIKNNTDILSSLVSPDQTQMVWLIEWKQFIAKIDSVNQDEITSGYFSDTIVSEIEKADNNTASCFWPCANHRFYLQNDVSLITEPGEFCYDKTSGKLYYYPLEGQTADNIEGYIPNAYNLLSIAGTKYNVIKNVSFCGIEFANTKIDYQDKYNGCAILQALEFFYSKPQGNVSTTQIGAAITVSYSENITFEKCIFDNLGLSAISLQAGIKNSKINGCIFKDLGNSAIVVSNIQDYKPRIASAFNNNVITNNVIRKTSQLNFSAPAITVYYTRNTIIKHNDMYDLPYTAISIGWGWDGARDSYAGNNIVASNKIGKYLTKLKDGGGIYTLGVQTGSKIENNYLYSQCSAFAAIYHDEGTTGMTDRNNAVYINDITDENNDVVIKDYYKELPNFFWLMINSTVENGKIKDNIVDMKIINNYWFNGGGTGKVDSHPNNVIPPIMNDDENLRNVQFFTREEFLENYNVKIIMNSCGLEPDYKCLLTTHK